MSYLAEAILFIESNETTIDLLKWAVVGLVAWMLGIFRYLKTKLKRPTLEVEAFTSRCSWEELGEIDGNPGNVRVILLIEAGINNPTTEPIVVRYFTLHVKRLKSWPIWNEALNPTTLPCRVRHVVGDVTRYLKNWFSNFEEGPEYLTLSPRVESREFQSGFLIFVSASWGNMRPLVTDKGIPIKLKARLTTGETLVAKTSITVLENQTIMDSLVPGVFKHVENPATWNIVRSKS
ncbi:hypothetical protein [Halopseudomonas aestusnigri]|uniref:Uncharacterized protein n=1 Tax=Halopseudomonas aestusnigri TaxID=857252 RepID=A0AAQ1GAZ0_9GAMM|nr:hypothetical protein [Halopseudomonas aestusnigri]SEG74863.1 hypothetical protein SAMN05216586_1271 [Halopseudomonas aestusnigri]